MGVNESGTPHIVPLTVAPDGYVYADGVKVARLHRGRGTLEFHDKNRQRCEMLGRKSVEVKLDDLATLAETHAG